MHTRLERFSIAFVIFLGLLFFGLQNTARAVLLQPISEDFGVSYTASGLIFLVSFLSVIIANVAAGRLMQRFGMRAVYVVSVLGIALVLLVQAYSAVYAVFIAATFMLTIFTSGQNLSGNSLVAATFAGDGGAKLNLLHFFYGFGSCLAALSFPLLAVATEGGGFGFTWREIFIVLALLFFLVLTWYPFYRFKQKNEPSKVHVAAGAGVAVEGADEAGAGTVRNLLSAFKNPLLLKISLAAIFATGYEVSVSSWFVYVLEDGVGKSTNFAVLMLALFFAGLAIGRIGGSFLAGRNWLEPLLFPLAIFQAILAVLSLVFLPSLPWLFALAGLTSSIYFPTFFYKIVHLCPSAGSGAAFLIISGFGVAFFPFMVGVFGDIATIRWGFAVAVFCAVLLVPTLRYAQRAEASNKRV